MAVRAQKSGSVGAGDSAQVLALSLFLMLLAFFIVLSTFSDFEENRVAAIQNSMEDTFSSGSDLMGNTGAPSDTVGDDFDRNSGQAFDDIEALLKAQIGLISITRDAKSGIMAISMPEKAVFEDHLNPYASDKTLAGEIARIINQVKGKSVEFRAQVNAHFDQTTLAPQTKIKGLGVFARSMMQNGVPPKAVSIGLVSSKPGYVDLVFEAYRGGDQPHLSIDDQAVTP